MLSAASDSRCRPHSQPPAPESLILPRTRRTQYRLLLIIGGILVFGFVSVGITAYLVSRNAIRNGIVQQALPLTADNIYSEIQKDLLRPVLISSVMAQDTFLREWILDGERDPTRITRYMKEIKERYGSNTAFLVSEKSHRYYEENGVLKTVSERDPLDKWYFRVREMRAPFESNVDPDEANRNQLTVFINYRVLDYRGNFIGVTGVGLALDQIGSHIDRYQSIFNRRIYFVDRDGVIVLSGKSMKGAHGSIRKMAGIDSIAGQILNGGDTPRQLQYRNGGSLVLVNSRYIPELNNFLVVEQDEYEDLKSVQRALGYNLLIGAVLSGLVLLLTWRTVDRYQRRVGLLIEEALAHAARETEMAHQQKEFVAMVSHEFRTPLAIIDSGLQGLKRHEEEMTEEVSSRFKRIRRAALRLQELIGNYLTGDRLNQASFAIGSETIDLFQLISRTAERVEWPNLTIANDVAAHVTGDPELLRIVFFNLFNNAIKHSPADGHITVEGRLMEREVEVCVRDEGSGIGPDDLPHVFDKHYRARQNPNSGTGLGLYLVRRIIAAHGGTVSAESVVSQGTTIRIRLPVIDTPATTPH